MFGTRAAALPEGGHSRFWFRLRLHPIPPTWSEPTAAVALHPIEFSPKEQYFREAENRVQKLVF